MSRGDRVRLCLTKKKKRKKRKHSILKIKCSFVVMKQKHTRRKIPGANNMCGKGIVTE